MKSPNLHGIEHTLVGLTIVLVPDPNLGGYTSFFKEYSNVISQGETKTEAILNLIGAFYDVIKNGFIKFDE